MESGVEKEDILLVCIDYMCYIKNVLVSLLAKEAGSTLLGQPCLENSLKSLAMCVQEKLHDHTSYKIISMNHTW